MITEYKDYQVIKAHNIDRLLLYRIGEFYNAFGNDAIVIARALHISLKHTHKSEWGVNVARCIVPADMIDNFLAIKLLTDKGFIIATHSDTKTRYYEPSKGAIQ